MKTAIVVPCYNEAARLPAAIFERFAGDEPEIDFVLVNDGSRDDTLERLHALARTAPERFQVVDRQPNRGKAETVRAGLRAALERGASFVGYWDADLATPLDVIPEFRAVLDAQPRRVAVLGARVQLLGRAIERSPARHYLGRVFATAASGVLRMPVYDTQCGAKLFRAVPALERAIVAPFLTNWSFDVELLARLSQALREEGCAAPESAFYELPLDRWHDVAGSKVRPTDFFVGLYELWKIRQRYR